MPWGSTVSRGGLLWLERVGVWLYLPAVCVEAGPGLPTLSITRPLVYSAFTQSSPRVPLPLPTPAAPVIRRLVDDGGGDRRTHRRRHLPERHHRRHDHPPALRGRPRLHLGPHQPPAQPRRRRPHGRRPPRVQVVGGGARVRFPAAAAARRRFCDGDAVRAAVQGRLSGQAVLLIGPSVAAGRFLRWGRRRGRGEQRLVAAYQSAPPVASSEGADGRR